MINVPLGFENLPGLSAKDFITLAIIRRYIDFKVSIAEENISTGYMFARITNYLRIWERNNPSQAVIYVTSCLLFYKKCKFVYGIKGNYPTSIIPAFPGSSFVFLQIFVSV